ncbi:MAG: Phosphate-selective porin [Deltaproteobacteria bacterium]|nr:Phosphate-selective porin [Deltaproteobacteria bacterium]
MTIISKINRCLSNKNPWILFPSAVTALFALCLAGPGWAVEIAADPRDRKIQELEKTVGVLSERVDAMDKVKASSGGSWADRFTLGGYGEMHANFGEGSAPDQFDIHRLVAYVGYTFSDWIRFSSEVEIEHAFVSSESDGEIYIEQACLDFLLSGPVNIRFGRVLVPVGITNRKHEPPTFYGVERPSFDRVIIPTTWFADGIGAFGGLGSSLKYELYLVSGLDGSQFSAVNGIRDGRIKERASLHEPAVTGRLDFFPFVRWPGPGRFFRLGASAYYGGVDNGNQGKNPGIDGEVTILSGDFEYSVSKLDFRGAVAHERIHGAKEIGNGTASEIFGWYVEGGVRVFPDAWKKGKLAKSDAAVFVRYEDFDTQHRMPDGVAKNPAGDRREWTFGASFYLTPTLVAKGDVQFRDDASGNDLPTLINFGLGWQF